jgi:exportin-2 (importin alpha re-exporter)
VFQLLAQLLDFHTGKELSEAYIALLDPLLNPALWEYGKSLTAFGNTEAEHNN